MSYAIFKATQEAQLCILCILLIHMCTAQKTTTKIQKHLSMLIQVLTPHTFSINKAINTSSKYLRHLPFFYHLTSKESLILVGKF